MIQLHFMVDKRWHEVLTLSTAFYDLSVSRKIKNVQIRRYGNRGVKKQNSQIEDFSRYLLAFPDSENFRHNRTFLMRFSAKKKIEFGIPENSSTKQLLLVLKNRCIFPIYRKENFPNLVINNLQKFSTK